MTQASPSPPTEDRGISFWRRIFNYLFDVRFLGVLGQIAIILVVVFVASLLGGNFFQSVHKLGEAQFICRDGSFSYRCAYDFMGSDS